MHIRFNLLISFLLLTISTIAQSNAVLFTIDGNKYYLNEFKEALDNSNLDNKNDKNECRAFLNQFIEFKLQVLEAERARLDKNSNFIDKVKEYKKQLTHPYLYDKQTVEKLAREAYERKKTEIRVRQILVKISPFASPKDTLIAFEKIKNIKKRLVSGENFEKVVAEVSDDYNAAKNKGDLWYIGPFKVPYKVENYIYSNPQAKYSPPIRSEQGYHIVEILDKRPFQGIIKVAHIMVANPADTSKIEQDKAKQKIDELYLKAIGGQDFKQLAIEFSDDKGAATNGGELPAFETGDMEHEFEAACDKLSSVGDISKPVRTKFGWHIIKLLSKEELPSFEALRSDLEQKVIEDSRGKIAKNISLEKLKSKYNFKDYHDLFGIFEIVDSTIFEAKWKKPEIADLEAKLFEFNNRTYYQKDFANYLENNQSVMFPIPIDSYVNNKYDEFISSVLFRFESNEAENSNPLIESKLKEYKENILAYSIAEKEVWSKVANEEGLVDFYNKHKSDYITIFKYSADLKKVEKLFMKLKKQQAPDNELVSIIKSRADLGFGLIEKAVFNDGQNEFFDKVIARYKSGEIKNSNKFIAFEKEQRIVWLNSEITHTSKKIEDVKGSVISDYRKYMLDNWIKTLKNKYTIEVNESTFESIF